VKTCWDCKTLKEFTKYSKCKRNKDGFQGRCKACHSKYKKEWRAKNIQRISAQNKSYYENNDIRSYNAIYRALNRDAVRSAKSEWVKKNIGTVNAQTAKRRSSKMLRTPPWTTPEMKRQMRLVYVEARELTDKTGVSMEVDHIVPLQGETVSGLHVPWNLQILTYKENASKGNKLK
jgi:5-methylcytosine-specific restriction endonuclease McrA